MNTILQKADKAGIAQGAALIRKGQVVAFPTETVYGLGADGTDSEAVRRVFEAKDRPRDNPLIQHIAEFSAWLPLVEDTPPLARALAAAFWPGPLTIILPASGVIPPEARAGLPTVSVRMPDHPVATALIQAAGVPIAAPSANRSGRPSPTDAGRVWEDLRGRIPMILDGGSCRVGLESTVISLEGNGVRILRPGGITPEMLETVVQQVKIDPAVLAPLEGRRIAPSPGMKHRHYAPNTPLRVAIGEPDTQIRRLSDAYDILEGQGERPILLIVEEMAPSAGSRRRIPWGSLKHPETLAENLFSVLRQVDESGASIGLCQSVPPSGMGLAVMNRLLRAAGYRTLD